MKILICVILLSLVSCNVDDYRYDNDDTPEVLIVTKVRVTGDKFIARYYTTTYWFKTAVGYKHYKSVSFLDTVKKFNVGDTIIFNKK